MSTPLKFRFDGRQVIVHASTDGRIWFTAEAICQALEFPDIHAALLYHCRPDGILFGNEHSPLARIDLQNLLQLSRHCSAHRAARLQGWLCDELLPALLVHSEMPQHHQLSNTDQRLQALKWQGNWWLSVEDVMQLFGTHSGTALPVSQHEPL